MELEKNKISRRELLKLGGILIAGAAMGEIAYTVRKKAGEEIDKELKKEDAVNGTLPKLPNP